MSRLPQQAPYDPRSGNPPKLYLPSQMTPIPVDDSPELPPATLSTFMSHDEDDVFGTEQSNTHASSSRNYSRYVSESPGSWNPNTSRNSLTLQSPEYFTPQTHFSSTSHTRTRISPVSQPHLPQPRVSVESLDHNTLLSNALYRDLYCQNLALQAKVEAFEKSLDILGTRSRLDTSAGLPNPGPLIAGDPSNTFNSTSTTLTSAPAGADPFQTSYTHTLLQQLDESKFPRVRYWHKHIWMSHGKGKNAITDVDDDNAIPGKTRITQGKNVQFTFVEDINGEIWTRWKLQELTGLLRKLYKEFEARQLAPCSWTHLPAHLNNFVRISCYAAYPDLRFCEGHWKLEYIASRTYSGWNGNKLPAPEVKASSKRRTTTKNDGDYMHRVPKRVPADELPEQKSTKKLKVPKTKVIDTKSMPDTSSSTLSSPSDQLSFSLPSTSPATSAPLSPILPDSALAKLPEPTAQIMAPSIDPPATASASSGGNRSFIGNSLHEIITKLGAAAEMLPATVDTTAAEPTTLDTTHVATTIVEPAAVEPATIATTTVETAHVATTAVEPAAVETATVEIATVHTTAVEPTAVEPASVTTVTETPSSLTQNTTPATPVTSSVMVINPLAAISQFVATEIPKDILLGPSTSKGKPKGKGKAKGDPDVDIMIPTKGTNMKNLFAIDFCKTNTVTKAVFEQAWKNLSKDAKQHYKALSAKTKASAEEAVATMMAAAAAGASGSK